MKLPDIQAHHPDIQINLTRVGVTNVKKLVQVARKDKRPYIFISNFDLFVDLPENIKGANLSRNFEAMDEVLEEAIDSPVYVMEDLCSEVAKRLLERHEYASRAEVVMRSEYIVKRRAPKSNIQCQSSVDIFADAVAFRDAKKKSLKMIGAELVGITACPCAQEIMREHAMEELEKLKVPDDVIDKFLSKVPMATHNQRGRGFISIEVHDDYIAPLDKIIKIIEESMSSNIYEVLKRSDEAYIVERAHSNPKFVEDCVRTMAKEVVKEFDNLPDDSMVTIKQLNEESIHQHNAFAERVATLGELREELKRAVNGEV